jgi:hypothetical protein
VEEEIGLETREAEQADEGDGRGRGQPVGAGECDGRAFLE